MLLRRPLITTYYLLAIEHAVLIRNLLPRGERKISAYEMLKGKDPRKIIERLHTFGAKAFVHNQKDDITKMMDKVFEGIYIGYDIRSESHKILNVNTGKIINTVNVKIEDKVNSKKIKVNKKKNDNIEESTEVTEDVREELLPPDELYQHQILSQKILRQLFPKILK